MLQRIPCSCHRTAGTTGTPYPYVKELLEYGHYTGRNYTYGINWANEFAKTMMQQAYKKGKIVEYWNRKIQHDLGIMLSE